MVLQADSRFAHLDRVLSHPGPFVDPDEFPGADQAKHFLQTQSKVLVIGPSSFEPSPSPTRAPLTRSSSAARSSPTSP